MYKEKKPIKRSKFRLIVGKKYYILKRHLDWWFSGKNFANKIANYSLQYQVFNHKTPLIRKLKDVDMYLQYNKITNLKIAVKNLNGLIIKPGETFSFWKLIGKPSYRRGYLDGLVLTPNGSFKPGVGGGLCQLSNLIYWMTLHSSLTVTERHRHSFDIFPDVNRTQPFGAGATCSYCSYDIQIFNGTNSEFQLNVYLTKDDLVGEWRSSDMHMNKYEVYEKDHSITSGFGGYIRNNTIYRKVINTNIGLIKDEYVTENHAYMTYPPFLSDGKSNDKSH